MSAPIIEFSEAFKSAIEAGQSVVEGNVVKIIADNGTEIGNATLKVINGGNGVASEAYALTGAVSGGVATTSGLGIMAVSMETAAFALCAATGVALGVTWYNANPDLWIGIADSLDRAGRTIGGKIVTYFNGDNIYFDQLTIETFKQGLVDAGIFAEYGYVSDPEYLYEPDVLGNVKLVTSAQIVHKSPVDPYDYIRYSPDAKMVCYYYRNNPSQGYIDFVSKTPAKMVVHYYDGHEQVYDIDSEITTAAGNTAYIYNMNQTFDSDYTEYNANDLDMAGHSIAGISADIAQIILFGNNTTPSYLQDGAVYPDSNPFTDTYPGWLKFEYPSTAPQHLPDVYPVQYPSTDPNALPEQYPSQHPDPESIPETYPVIIPDLPLPKPGSHTEPETEPDPETQPDPEPIENPEIPDPIEDPIDPNEPIPPSPAIPVPLIPATVGSNKLFTVYNPTSSQLDQLGGYLWDDNLMEILKKIWQDPLDGIISLHQIYVTPTTGGSHNIILGYLDSGVSSAVVTSQFVTVDCGSVDIDELKNNATDYAPFVSLHVYLPFIGIAELDVNEFMNGSMGIKYKVDVYTGTCIAEISCTRTQDMPNGNKVYEFSGNCSQQIPLTSGSATGLLSTVLNGISAGLSIASGGSLGVVAGMSMAGHSLSHEMLHVSHSGNLSANAGILGNRKPFVIITRGQSYDANSYNGFYGFPANKTVYLNNCTGFVKVKSMKLKTTATDSERQEIIDLLTEGVFI